MTPRQIEQCVSTLRQIVRSPGVGEYVVGFTSNIRLRQFAYRGVGMPHLVVIAADLDCEVALKLEEHIQNLIKGNPRSLLYKKYNPPRVIAPYRKSKGGRQLNNGERCAIYIAWSVETYLEKEAAGRYLV